MARRSNPFGDPLYYTCRFCKAGSIAPTGYDTKRSASITAQNATKVSGGSHLSVHPASEHDGDSHKSRLTQSFLGLSNDAFCVVPILEKAPTDAINTHLDEHYSSTGTVMTALACIAGESIVANGADAQAVKAKFMEIWIPISALRGR